MKTVAITGAAGFLGQSLVSAFLKADYQVYALVRKRNSTHTFPKEVRTIETGDIFEKDVETLSGYTNGIDTIIHAAWELNETNYLSSEANLRCLEGSLRLAQAFSRSGGKKFVGIGTCFEYDLRGGYVSTDTSLEPKSLYAASKASLFHLLNNYFQESDMDFLWCRLFYLYGRGEKSNRLVPYIRRQLESGNNALLTSGNQVRDFLEISVAAEMIASDIDKGKTGPINICSSVPITVKDLAYSIADEYNRRDLLKFGSREDNPFDPQVVVGIR
jgi:dTDP-6-deoxy-L-talose 4-dehydrogenase (NAD+)